MIENIKIAHFIHDEKFPDSAYELFETVAPNCNTFYIASKPSDLKYIKKTPVNFINKFSYKNPFFMRELEKYNIVVLHSLSKFNQQLVLHSDTSKVTFVWIGMGYDYYDLIYDSKNSFLLPETEAIAVKYWNKSIKNLLKVRKIASFLLRKIIEKSSSKPEILKKIHHFAPVLEVEYYLIKNKFNNRLSSGLPRYARWNYGVNRELIDRESENNQVLLGNDILLGNSASFTNNHIEMIDFLSRIDLQDKKVICPLSYGNPEYADFVINYAEKRIKDNFVPVTSFLPYNDYIKMISNCTNVVMNHKRQQAVGNISAMLAKGAKVFLREENPLYQHYKSMGIKLFTIQSLLETPELLEKPLPRDDIQKNKKKIKDFLGSEAAIYKTRCLIEQITQSQKTGSSLALPG